MSANQLFLAILLALVVGQFALYAACVKWGLNWAGIAKVSFLKALGLYFLVAVISSLLAEVLSAVTLWATSIDEPSQVIDLLLGYIVGFAFAVLVVALTYKARVVQASKAMIPLVLGVTASFAVVFVIRAYAYEAFYIPTNAMAPTLLGVHWEAPCPKCGHSAYGSPLDSHAPIPPEGVLMICSNERQSLLVSNLPDEIGDGDRILTCKFIAPRRWDMIAFRYPEDPTVNYVMRLVGLPGEKLSIRDGAVWINGEKLDPPESVKGIEYSPTIDLNGQVYSGPGSQPVELGPDEYFVLGDFAQQSSDSRMWERGAPGYPPYAVPEANITGVVINIYWPINRWTAFR